MVKYGKMNAAYSMITYHNPHLQVPLQLARQRKPATHVGIGVDVDPGAAQLCIRTSICDSERLGRIQCTQKEHGWLFFGICDCFRVTCLVCLMSILPSCMDLA